MLAAAVQLVPLLAAHERFFSYAPAAGSSSSSSPPFSTVATEFMLQVLAADQPVYFEAFGAFFFFFC